VLNHRLKHLGCYKGVTIVLQAWYKDLT
jgi:hypothetical protein